MSERIGKYEILSEIGRGSFARVYRAYDPMTQRNVAIKVLTLSDDPDALARFFLEVKATANLNHKNIVTIFDFNREPPYIVMELVEGESLKQIIAGKRLSLLESVRILRQAADGLAHAHSSGIVHRDIKPANIMVPLNGNAKIMDFGIALVSGETEARRTRQGDLIGTILYMSPERIEGSEADARADIFSFGVVGCELITGSHPFDGKDYATVIHKILNHEIPRLQTLLPECPEAFDQIIQRATAKHPEARYQSMEEILTDLKPVLLDLEQQQAAAMMASMMQDVQGLISAGQFDEAQRKVLTVLHLDPTNREARQVHEFLQKDQRRKRVRVKVGTLIQEGSACLRQRQFDKAIECFESALRLDPDSDAGAQLTQAKAAQEAHRQAGRLTSEARREISVGNLDAACDYASRARHADAEHPEAAELFEQLQQQVAERGRLRRVEKAFDQIEQSLSQNHFQEARSVLAEIRPDANRDAVQELLARIQAAEAEQSRRDREFRVQNAIAKANALLQADLLVEAEGTLRDLLKEFPEAADAAKLLAAVRALLDGRRRAQAISELTQKALGLLQAHDYIEARRLLETALPTYPAEPQLRPLLDRALDLQKGSERAQAIARCLQETQTLRAAGSIEEALSRVIAAVLEYGPNTALTDLKHDLEFDREQQQYRASLLEAIAGAQKLIDAERFAEAVTELEASAARYAGEPQLRSLLASARRSLAEQEEKQVVARTQAQIAEYGGRQQWQAALECAEAAMRSYPYNARLSELATQTRENLRQYSVRRRQSIERKLASGDLAGAAQDLRSAQQEFPQEVAFSQMDERLKQEEVRARIENLEQQVMQTLKSGDLERAFQELDAARAMAADPRWQALDRELRRRQAYHGGLKSARSAKDRGEIDAAEETVRALLRDNPPDHQASALLNTILAEREQRKGEVAYLQTLEKADQLRAAGHFNQAEEILQEAVRHALDRRAGELLETVREERGEYEQQRRREQCIAEIRLALDRSDFHNALALLDGSVRDFPGDAELARLRGIAERQRDCLEALGRIRQLEQKGQYEAALDIAEKAMDAESGNQELNAAQARVRLAALDQWVNGVRSCFAANDLEGAGTLLDRRRRRWGQEKAWQDLQQELTERRARDAAARKGEAGRKQLEQTILEGRLRAEALKNKPDLQGALEALTGLCRQFPDHTGLALDRQTLLRMIEVDFVKQALTRITALEKDEKWDAAIEEAERSLAQYPDNADLIAIAREERQRKELAGAVRKIGETIAAKDWPEADRQLLAAEAHFPGEPAFGRLREALQKGQRNEELENLRSTVAKHFLAGELEEAAGQISHAKLEFGEEPVWRDLHQQLKFRRNYERTLHEAEKLQLEAKHQPAEDLLRPVLADAPDARAAALLRSITVQRIQKQRDDAIAQARREVARLLNQGNIAEGLGILDRICQKYPDELALADQRKDVADRAESQRREVERQETERRHAAERAHKILTCRTAMDAAVKAGLWDEALKAIESVERELPSDPALVELRRQLEDQKRRVTLEIMVGQVRKSLGRCDLDGAARQIAGWRLDFPDEPIWETLQEELAGHRQYESLLTDAQNLIIDARYDAAQGKLREAVDLNSGDLRAAALLKEIGDANSVRLRLSVQLRLMVRKYVRAIKLAGIAAALLLGVGIAGYVWRSKTPAIPITLVYRPTEVKLLYRVGDRLFPRDSVQFQPAQVDFEVSTQADWLRVSPIKGSSLDRLDLEVTKAPNTSSHLHTVLLLRARGRSVTNDAIQIPVDFDVKGIEEPKRPFPPPPKPLTLDPALVEVEYELGDKAPAAREVRVTQGEVAGVSARENWLRAQKTKAGLAIDFPMDGMRQLKAGVQVGDVIVEPKDKNVGTAHIAVVLTVTAKPAPVVIPVVPKDTAPKEQKTVPSPPPTPPQGNGCNHGVWGDVKSGNAIWKGKLPPNTLTPLDLPAVPPRRPLAIKIDEEDVTVLQTPQETNHCGPITVFTTRQDITVLHIRWVLASQ